MFRTDEQKSLSQKISTTTNDASQSILSTTTTTTTTITTTTKAINPINGIIRDIITEDLGLFLAGCTCPLCSEIYQTTCHRPIGELSCGHIICYQCFVLNTNQFGCIQCEKPSEVVAKKPFILF